MATWVWIVIAIAVVVVIGLVAAGARRRRTADLRDRFGPEYDRAVENRDGRRAAEADLRAREKERAQFDIEPLPEAARLRFANGRLLMTPGTLGALRPGAKNQLCGGWSFGGVGRLRC